MGREDGFQRIPPLLVWILVLGTVGLWFSWPNPRAINPGGSVGQTQSCLANLTQISRAFSLYAYDWDGKFPRGVDPEDRYNPQAWQAEYNGQYASLARTLPMLQDVLKPYTNNPEVWHCPADIGYEKSSLPGFDSSLRNVYPSSFAKYGTSYYYLTLRAFTGIRLSDSAHPGKDISLFDGDLWHRPTGRPSTNALFVDGHVKNLTADEFAELMKVDVTEGS
jgi:prepilin-type processing-associated H-X9-DG protein